MSNVIHLAQKLVQYRSVGSQILPVFSFVQNYLQDKGFRVRLFEFKDKNGNPVPGLFATIGQGGRHLLFSGHLDVVSPGEENDWKYSPFNGYIKNGSLYARGISDMKGAVACFISACENLLPDKSFEGRVSLLLSGDDEKPCVNTIHQMLKQLTAEGEKFDFCLFGSPTNPKRLGEEIKIGARGDIVFEITSFGLSGHPAYHPGLSNPLHNLLDLLSKLKMAALDTGNENFGPTTLQVISVDTGNLENNVIPAMATAKVDVRYNTNHQPSDIIAWLQKNVIFSSGQFELKYEILNEAYYNYPEPEISLLKEVIEHATGFTPQCSTNGSSSSARYISGFCPVVEFGLTNNLVHRVNEMAKVDDLYLLEIIYSDFLKTYFQILTDNIGAAGIRTA